MELEEVVRKATQVLSDAEKMIAEQLRTLSVAVREATAESQPKPEKPLWRVMIDTHKTEMVCVTDPLPKALWLINSVHLSQGTDRDVKESLAALCALCEAQVRDVQDYQVPTMNSRDPEDKITAWMLLCELASYDNCPYEDEFDGPQDGNWMWLGSTAAEWLRRLTRESDMGADI